MRTTKGSTKFLAAIGGAIAITIGAWIVSDLDPVEAQPANSLVVCVVPQWQAEGDICNFGYLGCGAFLVTESANRGRIVWCNDSDSLNDYIAPAEATDRTGWYILSDDMNTQAEWKDQIGVGSFDADNEFLMGAGRVWELTLSDHLRGQITDETGGLDTGSMVVFSDFPVLELGLKVGTGAIGADRVLTTYDFPTDDRFFYDHSAVATAMYAAQVNGTVIRTLGGHFTEGSGDGLPGITIKKDAIDLGAAGRPVSAAITMRTRFAAVAGGSFNGKVTVQGDDSKTASATQTQAGGTAIGDSWVYECSVVATTGDSLTLPGAQSGRLIEIINNGANALWLWPAVGDKIGANAIDAKVVVSANRSVLCAGINTAKWSCNQKTQL